ncbi:ATP synthase F1 subcomplex delta subunit [Zymomonas mobilis]|uniref:F0F1 ATP synthase subunit delta n=1 Tax=Zymomonas mobilis TaxID=542 RepID=UPI00026D7E92|nr:F0F1 ATP synthase subunit delta [Zymomonas mobilis]AFN56868.1 ATP synthase subunit delta [Zymomonas mobilis subsp. mobilis ATCC 29191]TQK77696.1 ATP synthase F1 subcomplex delta subunit [Zymomonas mobilis]TQL15654.1 ATP synthase F1 subcomplex delta subunit [Zymomonas mobilis]GEB87952.1 ATP synthase subunit delta [Zymomonas mobilis subsp. mobilis]
MEISGSIQASLGGRYALALFEVAQEKGQIDTVAASLGKFDEAFAQVKELRLLANNQIFSRKHVEKAIAALVPVLAIDDLTAKFLNLLAAKGRLGAFPEIASAYRQYVADLRSEKVADVITAHPLSDEQKSTLTARLKEQLKADVQINATVDPSILGGMIVRLGSRQIDGSIRSKLHMLAQAMKG